MDHAKNDPPAMLATLCWTRDIEIDQEAGRVIAEFEPKPHLTHSGGVVQGGFVTGWLDSCMARAAIARTGFERMGRSIAFLAARAVDEEGEIVATGTSTARLLRGRGFAGMKRDESREGDTGGTE